MTKLEVYGLKMPEIEPGVDLAKLIVKAANSDNIEIADGDVIVVTSKVYLKSKGLIFDLSKIKPSRTAKILYSIGPERGEGG